MKKDKEVGDNLKLIAKSSVVVFVGLFLAKILNYVYRIIIARNLGPEAFGVFVLTIMIGGFITSLASLGFSEGLVRYIPIYRGGKEYDKIKYLFKASLIFTFVLGLISGLILFIFSEFISIRIFHNSDLIFFLKILSAAIPLILIYNIFISVLRAYEKISWNSFIDNILQNVIKVGVLILFIFLGFGLNSIIYSYIIAVAGILMASYLVLKYKVRNIFERPEINKNINRKIIVEFFHYSWPIMIYGLVDTIFVSTDSFVIGYLTDISQVGYYNVAISIATLLLFPPMFFSRLFFPLINKEYAKKNIGLIKEMSKQVMKWIFILNLPILLIMLIFPGTIINLLFGSDYLIAENALRFLSFGIFIYSIGGTISNNLICMVGKSKLILYNLLIVSVVNIVLNLIFIPRYGINGAAFSTMLSTLLLSTILSIGAYKYSRVLPVRRKLLRIFLVSLIPIMILLFVMKFFDKGIMSLILLGSFFLLTYMLSIISTGCLDRNDLLILKDFKTKLGKFLPLSRKVS